MPSRTSPRAPAMSLVARPAGERAGQAADDEHEAGGVERLRLVDGAAVVVERGPAAGGVDRREHAAAAVARQRQAVRAHQLPAMRSSPIAATWSRQGEIARMPWRGAGLDDAVERHRRRAAVAVLIDSQWWSARSRASACGLSRRRRAAPAACCMRAHRELGLFQQAGRVGEAEQLRRSAAASARSAARRPS